MQRDLPVAVVRSYMTTMRKAWAAHSAETPFVPTNQVDAKNGPAMTYEKFAYHVQIRNHEARCERGQRRR